jgi:septum formation protein
MACERKGSRFFFMCIRLTEKLILASASPRRAELLRLLGLDFDVIPSHMDEASIHGETPPEQVLRLSREKAGRIADLFPEAMVLGADTVVVIGGRVLGKPGTVEDAREMLEALSGREHIVFTGFSLIRAVGNFRFSQVVQSARPFQGNPRR